MKEKNKTPQYAVRLVVLLVAAGTIFFTGLSFFVPEGSKLTGSYDAKSLLYIASAPVAYHGSESCGTADCHALLFKTWSDGAHGAHKEQSKCEVCHGAQGDHPGTVKKLPKVRGDGDIVQLCLTCHRKMKARSTTGQPQISPQEHPYPHEGMLICTQCHNPHSPALGAPKSGAEVTESAADNLKKSTTPDEPSIASTCFSCHGPSGRGGFAPVLAGQPYEALKDKLTKYRSGELTNPMMNPVASKLKDQEIDTLAHYFAEVS
jgi:cytochrome c553